MVKYKTVQTEERAKRNGTVKKRKFRQRLIYLGREKYEQRH